MKKLAIVAIVTMSVSLVAWSDRREIEPGEILSTRLDGQEQEPIFRLTGTSGRPPRIAVPEFIVTGDAELQAAGKTLSAVLWDDLEFEREFQMIGRDGAAKIPVVPAETLPYDTWKELGADGVVVGSIQRTDAGIQVEVRLMSVAKQMSTFGKRYGCSVRSVRLCAHTIADEIHKEERQLDGVARTKLAFSSDRDGERLGGTVEDRSIKEIYIADYDGGGPRRVTAVGSLTFAPAWSPDSRFLAYQSYTSRFSDIYIQGLYEYGTPTRPAQGTDIIQNYLPVWSPDGTRLAFASSRFGDANWDIYTVRRDGTDLRRLTDHAGSDGAPTWSPNGAQIAFTSDRSGSNQIYIMSADGGIPNRLTNEARADRPTWSPAPFNYLAYYAWTGSGNDVKKIDVATRVVTQLTDGQGTNESPTVSPNGRHIAFVTTRWGKEQIAIIGQDGKLERKVTATGNNRFPNWSRR